MMKKSAYLVQALALLLFIGLFLLLNLLLPDRTFSEKENRVLQSAPRFSFSSLLEGKFTAKFEDYVTDQFPFRDDWISLKARAELFLGKSSNNGVYLCENETLIQPFSAPSEKELQFRIDTINALQDAQDIPVCFALIPSSAEIYSDLLPAGAPNDSQRTVIDSAYAGFHGTTADIRSALLAHAEEPIFYRTDHHWTTLGAYYGYEAIAEAMGLEPVPLSDYQKTVITEAFYGSSYSSSGFTWVAPDSICTYVPQGQAVIMNYPAGEAVECSLYDDSALDGKDKYKYFYGGNTPLVTVDTGNLDAPSLLIIRDSYMDSLSPYLFSHFSQIHIVDLRYFHTSLKQYIADHGIDKILVCYSVSNFCEDGNLFLAAN